MATVLPNHKEPNAAELGAQADDMGRKVCKRYELAEKHKDLFQEQFTDAYDYGFPNRPDYNYVTPGETRTDLIYDDTLVQAIPEFASELQSGLVPAQGDIARLMVGPTVDPAQKRRYQGQLDEVTDFIHAKLRNSNFAEETHESFQDLAVSTLNMLMDIKGTLGNLEFTSVPLHECSHDIGPDGKPDGRFKCHKVPYKDIQAKFELKELPSEISQRVRNNPDEETEVIEGIWRNWKNRNTEEWQYFVVHKGSKITLKERTDKGKGSNPWLTARWSATNGEGWGRGLVMNVMPTVKSLNLVLQLILENAQVAIGGIWQYDSDGTINPDTIFLEPGTFIPRSPGSRIDPLESPTRFDVAQFVLEDARAAIRKGLLVDTLDQEGKTPVSATQIGEEIGRFSRRMGASYSRLMNEFVFEVFHRAIYLYKKRGLIELPEIDGKTIEIIAVSPLARAQNSRDITDFTRFLEVSKFALGEEQTSMALQPFEDQEFLAEGTGIPKNLLKTQAQLKQELEQLAQQAQENPQLAEMAGNVLK